MMRSCRCYWCSSFTLRIRDEFQTFIRDYDRLQYIAVILIYIQIGCALLGSLGALYNGVLLINLAIALFALVAIESSSRSLGRTYAVLLFCEILLDISWFILFTQEIWSISTESYGVLFIFSVRLTLAMQIIGFSVRLSSSFLWIQIYRLGVSYVDSAAPREADFDLRNSFLSPVTPAAVGRRCSESDDALGGSIYDPAYYSSLFEDGQDNLNKSLASWVSFEPPKTTVKRMLLQEHQKGCPMISSSKDKQHISPQMLEGAATVRPKDRTTPSTSFYSSGMKGMQDTSLEHASENQSTLFKWANDPAGELQSVGFKSPVFQSNAASALSSLSATQFSPVGRQNHARGTYNETSDELTSGISSVEKSNSSLINQTKSILQPETNIQQKPSIPTISPILTPSLLKKSSEMPNSNIQGNVSASSTIESERHGATTKILTIESEQNRDAQLSAPSDVPLSSAFPGTLSHFDAANKIQPVGKPSNHPAFSLPLSASSSPMISSLSAATSSTTSSSTISFGGSLSSSKATVDTKQTVASMPISLSSSSQIVSSSSSSASLATTFSTTSFLSLQAPKTPVSSSAPPIKSNLESPKTELQLPTDEVNSKDVNATTQTQTVQPLPPASESSAKLEPSVSSASAVEVSTGLASESRPRFPNIASAVSSAALTAQPISSSMPSTLFSTLVPTSASTVGGKNESWDTAISQEDEMEEEAPETGQTTELSLGSLGSFGLGSTPNPTAPKPNPFGGPFGNTETSLASSLFSMTVPSGQLFRPASFSFQSPQSSPSSPPTAFSSFSTGFGTGTAAQAPTQTGFGQPAQIGPGQQALGSVLGTFGPSRQFGAGLPGAGFASASGFGGGFASFASGGGGFAAAAAQPISSSMPSTPFSTVVPTSVRTVGGKNESWDTAISQEDEMEEEAPETGQTTELSLGSLGSFGLGSTPNPTAPKPNPFGGPFGNTETSPASSPFSTTVPSGQLFRPASFSFQSPQSSPSSPPTAFSSFSTGFGTGTAAQASTRTGFGQPAQIGPGQQALGSVLGTFGQSRQFGAGLPGAGFASASGFGGGFASFASGGGGFAAAAAQPISSSMPSTLFSTLVPTSTSTVGGKNESWDTAISQEDEMEEEAPETGQTTELSLGSLGSFGLDSTPNPTAPKPNPFGGPFGNTETSPASSPFSMTVPSGQLFRPASFSFQSLQSSPSSPPTAFSSFSTGFGTGTAAQASTRTGFGQPAQIGPGQQALGSVLGTFGQSRQFGAGLPGAGIASASGLGGGFASFASGGGGFAAAASGSGGFGAAASAGGGFGAAASGGGGFGGLPSAGGGFAAAASAGSGFPAAGGGFGAFSSQQGSGFGGSAGGSGKPSELFTQIRK